ncbi:hypothetical protein KBB27_04565, partial [Patescibacteria group bacterium]|nr:hypothetical protein [Patescibacteria group bacterium]
MASLLPVRQFIGLSWQRYTQHLGRFLEVSLWMLVPKLLQVALLFLLTSASIHLSLTSVWTANLLVTRLLSFVIGTWVSIRLIKLALSQNPKEEGYIATHPHVGWELFFPAVWINILFGVAVFGGFIAFALPGIWLGVALSFGMFLLVDTNTRGLQAIYGSYELVKHRWWPVLGRILLAGLTFLVLSFLILIILSLIQNVIFGSTATVEVARLSRSLLIDGALSTSSLRAFSISQLQDSL